MTDFFTALEAELHAATVRRSRRPIRVGQALGALAAIALLAVAVGVVMAISGGGDGRGHVTGGGKEPDPVGTVIPKGEGTPPRSSRSVVVAIGRAPSLGPWQMELSRSTRLAGENGEVYQPAGLPCLSLFPVGRSGQRWYGGGGQCGVFPRTPGFSRVQVARMVLRGHTRRNRRVLRAPILVYGRVPERAAAVVVSAADGLRLRTTPQEGPMGIRGNFYAISVPIHHPEARINWLDAHGEPGSRGIRLLPPISPL